MTRPGKPSDLVTRAETQAKKAVRATKERSLRPTVSLSMSPPAQLKGHAVAQATWRRTMRVYSQLEAEVVTRLDLPMLVDYCLLVEQAQELDEMRRAALDTWRRLTVALDQTPVDASTEDRLFLVEQVAQAVKDMTSLDARADRKRSLLFQLRQSLYLTPRARAGVAPAKKEQEPPKDDLEMLLDDVAQYVNGGQ